MENKGLTQQEKEKSEKLAIAVASKTPDEVREIYKSLGKVEFTARALAYACRFKGSEYVKALVECGATFEYDRSSVMYDYDFHLSLITFKDKRSKHYYMEALENVGESVFGDHLPVKGYEKTKVLPLEERIRIAEYLCKNAESSGFDSGEVLFYAILTKNYDMADALKKAGAVLSEKYIKLLSEGPKGVENGTYLWYQYCMIIGDPHGSDNVKMLGYFRSVLGDKTLHFTETIYASISSRVFYEPELFGFFLSIFNTSKMNKTHMLKIIIKNNLIADLEIAAGIGWLKQPRKRDEMIAYAAENGCTEASAWLLDYKNRTADVAAEQKKAEQRMLRELNASPDSVSELSKIWSYKKREDGTIIITSYKGNKEEVIVPAKIGKEPVTAIGAYAFSPCAPRVRDTQSANRKKIRRIVLPDSIKVIEKDAFYQCKSLEEINIPDGVTEICERTFSGCNFKSMIIPDSVQAIRDAAFSSCIKLEKINIPQGVPEITAYAFSHCKALKEIDLPDSVKCLGTWAFIYCENLSNVVLREGLEEIGKQAFSSCKSLTELEIPTSVKTIKNYKYKDKSSVTPFEKIPSLMITVTPKTSGERYCKRNELPYKIKEGCEPTPAKKRGKKSDK